VGAAVAEWLGFGLAVRVAVGVGSRRLDGAGAGACVAPGFGFAGVGFADFGFGFGGVCLAGLGFAGVCLAGVGFAGVGFALFGAAGVARCVAVGVGDGAALAGEEVGVARAVTDALGEAVVDIPAAAEPTPATATAPEATITSGIVVMIADFAARPFRPDPPARRGGVWLAKVH
jgi:hypothetical protein